MKKLKKPFFALIALAVGIGMLSCVSPFYGTAKIEEGWHMDVGVAGGTLILPHLDAWGFSSLIGVRGDVELRYGLNKYLGFHARGAIGYPMLDGALGIQTAFPLGLVTPALRTEISWYGGGPTFSPALLVGVGRTEWVTLGVRTHIPGNLGDSPHPEYGPYLDPFPIDCFVGIHLGRWNIFAGSQCFRHSYSNKPIASVGLGYKIK